MVTSAREIIKDLNPAEVEALISLPCQEACSRLFSADAIELTVLKLQGRTAPSRRQLRSSGKPVDADVFKSLQQQAHDAAQTLCRSGESLTHDDRGGLFVAPSASALSAAARTRSAAVATSSAAVPAPETLLKRVVSNENWVDELLDITCEILGVAMAASTFTASPPEKAGAALKAEVCGSSPSSFVSPALPSMFLLLLHRFLSGHLCLPLAFRCSSAIECAA